MKTFFMSIWNVTFVNVNQFVVQDLNVKLVQTWTFVNAVTIPEFSKWTLRMHQIKAKAKIIRSKSFTIKTFFVKIIIFAASSYHYSPTVYQLTTITSASVVTCDPSLALASSVRIAFTSACVKIATSPDKMTKQNLRSEVTIQPIELNW